MILPLRRDGFSAADPLSGSAASSPGMPGLKGSNVQLAVSASAG